MTGNRDRCSCPASGERIRHHSARDGKDQNSDFEGRFLLNVYHFYIIVKSKKKKNSLIGMREGYTSMPTSCLHLQTTPHQVLLQGGKVHKVTPLTGPCLSDSSRGKNSKAPTSSEGQRQVQSSRATGRSGLAHPSLCPELLWANLYQAGEASTPLTRAGWDLPRTPLSNHPLGLGGSSGRK